MIDTEFDDVVSSCCDDVGFFNIDEVASKIMTLHGSAYLDGWMYILFTKNDAVEYLKKEYEDLFAEEDD